MATFIHFPTRTQSELEEAARKIEDDLIAAKTVISSGAGDSTVSEKVLGSLIETKDRIYSDLFARFPDSGLLDGLARNQVIGAKRTRPRYA